MGHGSVPGRPLFLIQARWFVVGAQRNMRCCGPDYIELDGLAPLVTDLTTPPEEIGQTTMFVCEAIAEQIQWP